MNPIPAKWRILSQMSKKSWIRIGCTVLAAIAFVVFAVMNRPKEFIKVTVVPGMRKEEIGAVLEKDMHWSTAEENEFMEASSSPDYSEGVYFPDTYLIPAKELPAAVANRMISDFEEKFTPYEEAALDQDVKWTVVLTIASIIQREAAGPGDMPLVSGILWNRLNTNMRLDIDSTVQYARGDSAKGWWAPITPADLAIESPYNTYLHNGLPPHPIDSPDLDAIKAALNPASTTCLYYIHDTDGIIHCSDTFAGQKANTQKYLQ